MSCERFVMSQRFPQQPCSTWTIMNPTSRSEKGEPRKKVPRVGKEAPEAEEEAAGVEEAGAEGEGEEEEEDEARWCVRLLPRRDCLVEGDGESDDECEDDAVWGL